MDNNSDMSVEDASGEVLGEALGDVSGVASRGTPTETQAPGPLAAKKYILRGVYGLSFPAALEEEIIDTMMLSEKFEELAVVGEYSGAKLNCVHEKITNTRSAFVLPEVFVASEEFGEPTRCATVLSLSDLETAEESDFAGVEFLRELFGLLSSGISAKKTMNLGLGWIYHIQEI